MHQEITLSHYSFSKYVNWRRWLSYYYQIFEALESGCNSFLVIGVGDGIVPLIIERFGYLVDTFDFDDSLNPTYCGDIRNLDEIVKTSYDCVICCQVLEHIEYDQLENIIQMISGIASERLIISLPVRKTEFSIYIDLPKIKEIVKLRLIFPKWWIKNIKWEGQHYWEVGIHGKSKKDIKRLISKYFIIMHDFHVPMYSFHWFLIAKSCQSKSH